MTLDEVQAMLDGSEAIRALGLEAEEVDADAGRVTLVMPFKSSLERGPGTGQFHGGPIASLIDIAGDVAIAVRVGGGVPTICLRVDYMRPSTRPFLRAVAQARRTGRSIGVADVDVFDEQGRLCAVGRGTYSTVVG